MWLTELKKTSWIILKLKHFIYLVLLGFITFLIIDNQKSIINSSHKSGFYSNPFKLTLSTDDKYKIFYTLDGSDPTNKSFKFQKYLFITGKESYDSLSFINTTIPDSIANFGWRKPIGIPDKVTIVKYAAFQNGSTVSNVKTLCFFLDIWNYNFLPNIKKIKF